MFFIRFQKDSGTIFHLRSKVIKLAILSAEDVCFHCGIRDWLPKEMVTLILYPPGNFSRGGFALLTQIPE
jgi:hypothetical protein